MKASTNAKKAVEDYLQSVADKDPLFAITLKKSKKNINDCLNYIMGVAKKSKSNMLTDEEVFGMAVHYYDEDSIMEVAPVDGEMTTGEDTSEPVKSTKKIEVCKKIKKNKAEKLSKQEALF